MQLTPNFRLRKPDGTDPVDVKDLNDNMDVLDTEVAKKMDKTGDASNAVAKFSQAGSRTNLTSGEKLSLSLGKAMKWFADLKTVAFSGNYADLTGRPTIPAGGIADASKVIDDIDDIAANTQAGYMAGALALKKVNSDLDGNRFGHTADGRPGWKDGADTVHPFNNLAAYHLTHSWDNLSQGPNNMYTITINLPACKDALLFLSARVNGISADAWTRTLNSGDLSAVEIGRKGAGLKANVATTMICLLVTSNNGCNVTFTTNDNDYQSVKIAMLLEP